MPDLITNTSAFLEPLEYSNRTTEEKAIIDALITAGSTIIERYCNRIFLSATYTDELYDGNGWDSIFVKNPPITSLTDIDILVQSFNSSTTTTTFASDKFLWDIDTGEIRFKPGDFLTEAGGVFSQGFRNVQITYVGGFTTVPSPVQRLTAKYVIQGFDPTEDVQNIEKEKLGDYFYAKGKDYIANLLFSDKKELDLYKIRKI